MTGIEDIQAIGEEIAIRWQDGTESYISMSHLRARSPSAETQGENDLLGQRIGGAEGERDFSSVTVTGWNYVGGYAIQFHFSDGHQTGIYSYDYLKSITTE